MLTADELVALCVERIAESPKQARRVFHGRGRTWPGYEQLVVTWFAPYVLIACYGEQNLQHGRDLAQQLPERVDRWSAENEVALGLEGIALQHRDGRRTHTEVVYGQVPDEHVVTEANLQYLVQPKRNQNVGIFLDMGHVRHYLASFAEQANVLNLFAYTCAFSVSLLEQGARQVVNVDMSKPAIAQGSRNHELNGHDLRKVRMLPHNLFKSWWKIRQLGPYQIVIIDPPTNQKGSFVAEKSYGQILKRLPEFCAPGARVMACLNSPFLNPEFLTQQMQRWCPACEFQQFLPAHPDFPDSFPERALKVAEFVYRP